MNTQKGYYAALRMLRHRATFGAAARDDLVYAVRALRESDALTPTEKRAELLVELLEQADAVETTHDPKVIARFLAALRAFLNEELSEGTRMRRREAELEEGHHALTCADCGHTTTFACEACGSHELDTEDDDDAEDVDEAAVHLPWDAANDDADDDAEDARRHGRESDARWFFTAGWDEPQEERVARMRESSHRGRGRHRSLATRVFESAYPSDRRVGWADAVARARAAVLG